MITLVRKRVGVPDSCYYYNNDNESINAKIKQKIERKRNDWPAFVAILKEMELAQNRNGLVLVCGDAEVGKSVERSLFDEGPYRNWLPSERQATNSLQWRHLRKGLS